MSKPLKTYHVDRASLRTCFPTAIEVPPLLDELGGFLAKLPHGCLGYFDALGGEPLPEALVDDDAALARLQAALAIFLELADGSFVALWRYAPDAPPAVVLLGSEGELTNLAPTLEAFLLAWTKGKTKVADLDEEADVTRRAALGAWLAERGVLPAKGKSAAAAPRFSTWVKATIAKRAAAKAVSKGPPKRAKVALATPAEAAKNASQIGERALALLGKRTDDPELIERMAGLGVDLAALKKPDELRFLELPSLGLAFELDWPWTYDEDFAKSERPALQAAKVRVLGKIRFCAAGYTTRSVVQRKDITFAGYRGALPWGLSFDDAPPSMEKKIGAPPKKIGSQLWWTDKPNHRRTIAALDERGRCEFLLCSVNYSK